MNKLLFLALFVTMFCVNMYAQYDDPAAYTTYYGLRMWNQSDNPGSDSLNQNWRDLDQILYDLIVAVDPRYFAWKDTGQDTLTLNTYEFGTLGFSTGENLYLPYHDDPYSNLGGGAVGYATGGWFVFRNAPNSRIDTLASHYWIRNNYGDPGGSVSSIEDLIDVASMSPSSYDILTYSAANGWYNNDISSIVQIQGIDFGTVDSAPLKLPYADALAGIPVAPRSLWMDGISGVYPRVYFFDVDSTERQLAVLSVPNTWTGEQTFNYLTLENDLYGSGSLASTPPYEEGTVFYDSTKHALVVMNDESEVTQQIGREFYIRVYNNSGSTITNGSVVYMSGSASYEPPVINLADASDEAKIRDLAFATHDIENGTYGYAVSAGIMNDINTSSFAVDESLYLDHLTPGGLTNTKPPAPYESIRVGLVLKSDATDGKVYVDIEEYHGVDDIAAIYFADSSYTITLTQNVEARITNTGNNLFSLDSSITHGISLSGDSVYVSDDGEYILDISLSFGGGTAGLYQIYTKTNGVTNSKYKAARATDNSDYGNFGLHAVLNLTAGDAVTFWVINTGSATDYIARHGNVVIEQVR